MGCTSIRALLIGMLCGMAVSTLTVLAPEHRVIKHTSGAFGTIKYGSSVTGRLYYANDGCKPTDVSPLLRQLMGGAFIVLVDRGGCKFSQKVRYAGHAGAEAVIVADNVEHEALTTMQDDKATDIKVPSIFISHHDGQYLEELFRRDHSHTAVLVSIDWVSHAPASHTVKWELWDTSFDSRFSSFHSSQLAAFAKIDAALGSAAAFAPHFFTVRGSEWYQAGHLWHCDESYNAAHPKCGKWCTNAGRYCVPDPDGDVHSGLDGADILQENLRQICLINEVRMVTGSAQEASKAFWRYTRAFTRRCHTTVQFTAKCAYATMRTELKMGADNVASVRSCVRGSGGAGLRAARNNRLLEKQIQTMRMHDVMGPATLVVDGKVYRGRLDCPEPIRLRTCNVLQRLCAALPAERREAADACNPKFWRDPSSFRHKSGSGSGDSSSTGASKSARLSAITRTSSTTDKSQTQTQTQTQARAGGLRWKPEYTVPTIALVAMVAAAATVLRARGSRRDGSYTAVSGAEAPSRNEVTPVEGV